MSQTSESESVSDDRRAVAIKTAVAKATRRFHGERNHEMRTIIANRIADVAQTTGELDPDRLCKRALQSIGLHD
jgi:hypothetical protein